jgi:hypothetical protein
VLDGIGVTQDRRRFLELSEVDRLWPRYLSQLRGGGDDREQWPADRREDVQLRIEELRKASSGLTVVWLALVKSEPLGVEVPADVLLGAGLGFLVSPAADLMLTTSDLAHGVCIEFNHLDAGDEYEIVTWGIFSG